MHIGSIGDKFVVGDNYLQETQKRGEWPAALHNNFIIGHGRKKRRFVKVGLWVLDDNEKCQKFPADPFLPPADSSKLSYAIKILCYNRPEHLSNLLSALLAADYSAFNGRVSLDIFIDYPDEEDAKNATIVARREECVTIARSFPWPADRGELRVIPRSVHMGLAGQWLTSWFPTCDTEVAMVLEDDNVVAPQFFQWLHSAVRRYFLDPAEYDSRLYGICMQSQHMIPGKNVYGKKTWELLPPGTTFFRYQQPSTWGPVFFAKQWAEFVSWYNSKTEDPDFNPYFSNMITNEWFMKRGGGRGVWSAWWMRFIAERGWYGLYTNFPNQMALVVNKRAAGVNFPRDLGDNSPMVEGQLAPYMTDFPSLRDLPLFDFHFNQIMEDPSILEGRGVYSDFYNVDTESEVA